MTNRPGFAAFVVGSMLLLELAVTGAALGILGMGIALLAFAGFERRSTPAQTAAFKRWMQAGALAYGGVGTLIWVTSWISVVTRLKWIRG